MSAPMSPDGAEREVLLEALHRASNWELQAALRGESGSLGAGVRHPYIEWWLEELEKEAELRGVPVPSRFTGDGEEDGYRPPRYTMYDWD